MCSRKHLWIVSGVTDCPIPTIEVRCGYCEARGEVVRPGFSTFSAEGWEGAYRSSSKHYVLPGRLHDSVKELEDSVGEIG